MAAHAYDAIVLRRTRFSETSLVTVLFSRDRGRIDALAKGCRRPRSSLYGHLDLFNVEEVLIYDRPRGTLELVTESYIQEEFISIRRRPDVYAAACLVAEFILTACLPNDPHPKTYDALLDGLRRMERGEPSSIVLIGVLQAIVRDFGFAPRLDVCAACHAALPPESDAALSGLRGGLICPRCEATGGGARVTARGIQVLRTMSAATHSAARISIPASEAASIVLALARYFEDVVGKEVKGKRIVAEFLRKENRLQRTKTTVWTSEARSCAAP